MDPSTQGTGGSCWRVSRRALKRLSGTAPLPYGAASGAITVPGGGGRIDLGNLFVMQEWSPPRGAPGDFPLVLRYKGGNNLVNEFGRSWSVPFHRFATTSEFFPNEAFVFTPLRAYVYDRVGTSDTYTPQAPGTNTLVGSVGAGWTETQRDGTSFRYDGGGVLRSVRNPAGVRWTLVWDGGFNRVQAVAAPSGRRTSFAYDGAGMIRRVQDAGGRICNVRGGRQPEPGARGDAGAVRDELRVLHDVRWRLQPDGRAGGPAGQPDDVRVHAAGDRGRRGAAVVPAAAGAGDDADGRLQPAADGDHRPARGPLDGVAGQPDAAGVVGGPVGGRGRATSGTRSRRTV